MLKCSAELVLTGVMLLAAFGCKNNTVQSSQTATTETYRPPDRLIWEVLGVQPNVASNELRKSLLNEMKDTQAPDLGNRKLNPIKNYLSYLGYFTEPGFSLGHTVFDGKSLISMSNTEYLSVVRKEVQFPSWLFDAEFFEAIKNFDSIANLAKLVADRNSQENRSGDQKIFFFQYQAGGGLSGAAGPGLRTLVVIPNANDTTDFYLQAATRRTMPVLSTIAVKKASGTRQWITYYVDLIPNAKGDKFLMPDTPRFQEACIICHKSGGPLAIFPAQAVAEDSEAARHISWIQERITKQYKIAHHPEYDQAAKALAANFPKLGDQDIKKTSVSDAINNLPQDLAGLKDEFTKKLQDPNWEDRIVKAASCTESSCHDGAYRDHLIPPFGEVIKDYVERGVMPPNNDLSTNERKLLYHLLLQEWEIAGRQYFLQQ